METTTPTPPAEPKFAVGDQVELRYNPGVIGSIVEVRGPIGHKGRVLYRIRLPYQPRPLYLNLAADYFDRV